MSIVGIEDLQEHAEDLLRRVAESGETIEIIHHGRVAARLVPPVSLKPDEDARAERDANDLATWARLMRRGEEIGRTWPEGVSAVDAIRDVRREL